MDFSPMNDVNFERFFNGEALVGDEFSPEEIEKWYEDEAEGYAGLVSDYQDYDYEYHALNIMHGFSKLPKGRLETAIGLGSAYGEEFFPILNRVDNLILVDPSEKSRPEVISGIPVKYIKPSILGDLDIASDSVDLATSFGSLHHIANVSHVIAEYSRILKPGGHFLIREPIVNMGDWRGPRGGLTKRERGIPSPIMRKAIENAGMEIVEESPCFFPPWHKLVYLFQKNKGLCSIPWQVRIDYWLSQIFKFNIHYNRNTMTKKIAPTSFMWVCRKV
jgi:SAM-dependent methyltransferase